MKNLINEIEKALQDTEKLYRHTSEVYNGYLKSHYRGKMEAYMSILQILKDYNIITAPKQIKLSEIVNKLKNAFVDLGNIDYEGFIEIGYGFITLNDEIVITIDLDSQKIVLIEFTNTFIELKWLYTLWIAGTEIVDDLKEGIYGTSHKR